MNDPRIMMSFRLPTSARDRISALMKQHGLTSQSELILMALDALDSVAPSQSLEQQLSGAIRRIEALEARLDATAPTAPAQIEINSTKQIDNELRQRAAMMSIGGSSFDDVRKMIEGVLNGKMTATFSGNCKRQHLQQWIDALAAGAGNDLQL